jgi:hypothetical protein
MRSKAVGGANQDTPNESRSSIFKTQRESSWRTVVICSATLGEVPLHPLWQILTLRNLDGGPSLFYLQDIISKHEHCSKDDGQPP